MNKLLIAASLVLILVSCRPPAQTTQVQYVPVPQQQQPVIVQQGPLPSTPDCDYDDMLEHDTDCGFPPKTTYTPSKKTTVVEKHYYYNKPTPKTVYVAPKTTTKQVYTPPKSTYRSTPSYKPTTRSYSSSSTSRSYSTSRSRR